MEEFIRFRRDKGRKLLLNIVLFLSWYSKKYDMLIRTCVIVVICLQSGTSIHNFNKIIQFGYLA